VKQSIVLDIGEGLSVPVLVADGLRDGPRVLILAGVHGDEYEGIASAASIWHDLDPRQLRGTVTVVPVANPPAFDVGTRVSPRDGLNLARTFPGAADGTPTERIAHALARLIRDADLLIDLHSAGQHYAMPLLAGSFASQDSLGQRCQAAALAFGAPIYWAHPDVSPGRSLSVALEADVACLYAECGGGGRVRPADLAAYRLGVQRVLEHIGSLPTRSEAAAQPVLRLRSTGDVDTAVSITHAGVLLERVGVLDRVSTGQVLAEVVDERGEVLEAIRSPSHGVVIMARRTARVRPGDGAYLVALLDEEAS
jgi:predicted deacylase